MLNLTVPTDPFLLTWRLLVSLVKILCSAVKQVKWKKMWCAFMAEQIHAYLWGSQHTEGESQEGAKAAGLNEGGRTFWVWIGPTWRNSDTHYQGFNAWYAKLALGLSTSNNVTYTLEIWFKCTHVLAYFVTRTLIKTLTCVASLVYRYKSDIDFRLLLSSDSEVTFTNLISWSPTADVLLLYFIALHCVVAKTTQPQFKLLKQTAS